MTFMLALFFGAGGAFAATDGILGAVSTASSGVSLTIAEQFRISQVQDLDLGAYSGGGALSANADVCVYSNGDGSYQVRITDSSVGGGGFSLENADGTAAVAMNVSWNDAAGPLGAQPAASGAPLPMSSANTVSADCSGGGLNANLSVTVADPALAAAPPGDYRSRLTIMVEPD